MYKSPAVEIARGKAVYHVILMNILLSNRL